MRVGLVRHRLKLLVFGERKVSDFLSDTGNQLDSLQSISGKLPKLLTTVGVKAPIDANAQPAPVTESIGN